jgi:Fibronectin type III domain
MCLYNVGHTRSRTARVGALACLWLGLLVAGNAGAQTPAAPPVSPTPAPATPLPPDLCKAQAKSPATDITIARDPATSWQPRGGEVRVVVESKVQTLKDIDAVICFRWSRKGTPAEWGGPAPVRVVEFSSATPPAKAVFSVTVPNLPPVTSSWFGRFGGTTAAGDQPDQFDTGMIVPLAEMKVVLVRANAVLTTAELEVGVTSVWNAVIATLVCIVGAHLVLYIWAVHRKVPGWSPWMRLVATREGYASLSQMQIMLWSFVFGAGAVYVMILSGSLINIPVSALVLLGIAGATTLGARIQGANAANAQPTAPELPAGAAAPAAPQNVRVLATTDHSATLAWDAPAAAAVHAVTYARQDFADWRQSGDRIKETSHRVGRLLPDSAYVFQVVARNASGDSPPVEVAGRTRQAVVIPRQPLWSDLVVTPQHPGEIDVTRVQMLFFTLISAGFVAIKLISGYTIPEIPEGFMLLMGISNGVYLSAKFVPD